MGPAPPGASATRSTGPGLPSSQRSNESGGRASPRVACYTSRGMDLSLFEYHLQPELIAQEPAEPRDVSRLLVLDRARKSWQERRFGELPTLLRSGECLVANETKVIPARLLGTREADGGPVELLMLRPLAGSRKSTRLNSSHVATSYAVFCLKKKK